MGRTRLYTDEENRERKRARAVRYNRAKAHRMQVERWTEAVRYIRQHDFEPEEELAHNLTEKWRLLDQYVDKKDNL